MPLPAILTALGVEASAATAAAPAATATAATATAAGTAGGAEGTSLTSLFSKFSDFSKELNDTQRPLQDFRSSVKETLRIFNSFGVLGKPVQQLGEIISSVADLGNKALAGGDVVASRSFDYAKSSVAAVASPVSVLTDAAMLSFGAILSTTTIPLVKEFGSELKMVVGYLSDFARGLDIVVSGLFELGKAQNDFTQFIRRQLPEERLKQGVVNVATGVRPIFEPFLPQGKGSSGGDNIVDRTLERVDKNRGGRGGLSGDDPFRKSIEMVLRTLERQYNLQLGAPVGFGNVSDIWERMQESNLRLDEIALQQLDVQRQMLNALKEAYGVGPSAQQKQVGQSLGGAFPLMVGR